VLLATKARMPVGEGPNGAGLSRYHLIRQCEASLRRLGTDHIDLYPYWHQAKTAPVVWARPICRFWVRV
jgi:aryl-alcohol dehydrogenase-like predicted oxidoreductase